MRCVALLDRADALKAAPLSSRALEGRSIALIFEKPSTRTRLSFEAGIFELGGNAVVLRSGELQLSRGESVGDTGRILSRHMAAIGVRTAPTRCSRSWPPGRRCRSSTCSRPAITPARRSPTS